MEELKEIIPNGLYGHTISPIYEKIIVLGGSYLKNNQVITTNTAIEFSITHKKWFKITTFNDELFEPRYYHSAFVHQNDKVYIFGGKNSKQNLCNNKFYFLNSEGFYDWKKIKTKGIKISPRYGCTITEFQGFYYLFGGSTGATYLKDLYKIEVTPKKLKINIVNLSLTEVIPRNFHICFKSINSDKLYFLGGKYEQFQGIYQSFQMKIKKKEEIFSFNPLFQVIDKLNQFQWYIINDNLLIIGGKDENNVFNKEIKIYNFMSKEWYSFPGIGVIKTAIFYFDYKLFLIGGYLENKNPNFVHSISLDQFGKKNILFQKKKAFFDPAHFEQFIDQIEKQSYKRTTTLNKPVYDFNVNIKEIDDIIVSSITRGILRERR